MEFAILADAPFDLETQANASADRQLFEKLSSRL